MERKHEIISTPQGKGKSCTYREMDDKLIREMLSTKMWYLKTCFTKPRILSLWSNMKGYSGGRYIVEVKPLYRRVKGKKYNISVFWTPYGGELKYKGRVNNYQELVAVLRSVNKDLIDTKRAPE